MGVITAVFIHDRREMHLSSCEIWRVVYGAIIASYSALTLFDFEFNASIRSLEQQIRLRHAESGESDVKSDEGLSDNIHQYSNYINRYIGC